MVNSLYKISQYRMVKILFTVYVAIFIFAIEIYIFSVANTNIIGVQNIIILIIFGIIMQYLNFKNKKSKFMLIIVIGINLIYSIVFHWILSEENYSIIIFIINLIYVFIYNKCDIYNVDTYRYKRLGKILSIVLVIVSLFFYIFLNSYEKSYMNKIYLLYVISYILLLRESRKFSFKLHNKKDNIAIIIYISIIMLMFTSSFNKIIKNIIKIMIYPLGKILELVANIIATILYYTIGLVIIKSQQLMQGNNMQTNSNGMKSGSQLMQELIKNSKHAEIKSECFFILTYIISALLVVTIVIVIIRKLRMRTIEKDGFTQIREEIEDINFKRKKEKKVTSIYDEKEKNIIFIYYRKFLKISFKKNLYKKYMTARQVKAMVNTKIPEKSKELKILTNIYNEAKFSKHHLTEEHTKNVENAYKNIEKPMKNI